MESRAGYTLLTESHSTYGVDFVNVASDRRNVHNGHVSHLSGNVSRDVDMN